MFVQNKQRGVQDPCDSYNESATISASFAGGVDGAWNLTLGLSAGSISAVRIEVLDGGSLLASAVFSSGDDIQSATPVSDSSFVSDIQPYLSGPFLVEDGGAGAFAKLPWAEDESYLFDSAVDLTFRVTPLDGGCEGVSDEALLSIQDYNVNASNPFQIDQRDSGEHIYRANSNDTIQRLKIAGSDQGKTETVDIDWSQIVLPAGITGTVTSVDLARGLSLSNDVLSFGRPDFFIFPAIFGLFSGATEISSKVTVCYCQFDGSVYIPTLAYWNANPNSTRQIEVTGRKINGRDVCQVGSTSRILYWNGSQWTYGFVATGFNSDAVFNEDGSTVYYGGGQSAVARRAFVGSTDNQYVSNSNWTGSSISAGTLSNPVANTPSGTIGSSIGIGEYAGICRIGYDNTLGSTSGSLMMMAMLDSVNRSVILLRERSLDDDLEQFTVNGLSVIDLTSVLPSDECKGISYDIASNSLYIGNGGNNIVVVSLDDGATSFSRISDENFIIAPNTRTF